VNPLIGTAINLALWRAGTVVVRMPCVGTFCYDQFCAAERENKISEMPISTRTICSKGFLQRTQTYGLVWAIMAMYPNAQVGIKLLPRTRLGPSPHKEEISNPTTYSVSMGDKGQKINRGNCCCHHAVASFNHFPKNRMIPYQLFQGINITENKKAFHG